MRCLLDTCTFLWIIAGSRELSPTAAKLFIDLSHEIVLSVGDLRETFTGKTASADSS